MQSAGLFVIISPIIEIQTMQNEVQALNTSEKRPKYSPTNKKQSAVDIVINKIVDDVLTGHYKPGDKLPTEMQLAEMMSMSKNTVREAIKILVAYGAVEIRRKEPSSRIRLRPRCSTPSFTRFFSARAMPMIFLA